MANNKIVFLRFQTAGVLEITPALEEEDITTSIEEVETSEAVAVPDPVDKRGLSANIVHDSPTDGESSLLNKLSPH